MYEYLQHFLEQSLDSCLWASFPFGDVASSLYQRNPAICHSRVAAFRFYSERSIGFRCHCF